MVRVTLMDSDGERVEVDEGESCDIIATFIDLESATLDEASLATITCTLINHHVHSSHSQDSFQSMHILTHTHTHTHT